MSAEHAYIAAQRAVFALERQADTIKLKRLSLETEISVLNAELIALSSDLEHRKDAAEGCAPGMADGGDGANRGDRIIMSGGVCLDALNPAGSPSVEQLRDLGVS